VRIKAAGSNGGCQNGKGAKDKGHISRLFSTDSYCCSFCRNVNIGKV